MCGEIKGPTIKQLLKKEKNEGITLMFSKSFNKENSGSISEISRK